MRRPRPATLPRDRRRFLGSIVALPQHASDRRRAELKTCASHNLGQSLGPDGREQSLQLPHEVAHDVGVAVDRLQRLYERPLLILVDASHPVLQGLQIDEEHASDPVQCPAPGCSELQDAQALDGRVVGSAAGVMPASPMSRVVARKRRPSLFIVILQF